MVQRHISITEETRLSDLLQLETKWSYIFYNWKRSRPIFHLLTFFYIFFITHILGQHNGDLKTLGGTSDWCHNFCDGNKWLMYMAFVMDILNFENFGRDFPGEWLQADLALPLTDEQLQNLKDEYRRKLVEDRSR
jgi:hypothetical protein